MSNRYNFWVKDFLSPRAIKPSPDDIQHHLILLVGASNTTGRGGAKVAKVDYTNPRILEYPIGGTLPNQLGLAEDPLTHLVTDSATTEIGFATTFAREYLRYLPTSDVVVLLPCATTGLGLSEGTGGNGFGSTQFNNIVAHVNNALTNLPNAKLECILSGIHGGNDVGMVDATYQTQIDTTFDGYCTQINKASKVPIGLFGYTPQSKIDTPARATKEQIFFGMKQRLPMRRIFTMTNQNSLTHNSGDTVHFNAASQRLIGKRLFDLLRPVII